MARSLNKVQLIGNLGSDPEVRATGTGKKVAQFSLATTRQWTTGAGEKQEKTEWHRLILWEGLAGVAERFLKKGDRCYVEGEIEYRTYEDKDKTTRYVTEIRVRDLIMLSGAREDGGGSSSPPPSGGSSRGQSQSRPAADAGPPDFPEEDDNLPF